MKRKIILIVHTSLDGFVANQKGTFDDFNPGPDNLDFVCSVVDHADAILAGRTSYQMLDMYWPTAYQLPNASASEIKYSNWYNSAKKVVVSKTLKNPKQNTFVIHEDIAGNIARLKNEPGKDIIIFGSPSLFQSIVDLNLIDEFHMIVYPVIFGDGIPLFKGNHNKTTLTLSGTQTLANGEIVLKYTA